MLTEDKITELFCIADDFCKFFDAMMAKWSVQPQGLIIVFFINHAFGHLSITMNAFVGLVAFLLDMAGGR